MQQQTCGIGLVWNGVTCVCPRGKVKDTSNPEGGCIPAAAVCGLAQVGRNDICNNCPGGMVAETTRMSCVHCSLRPGDPIQPGVPAGVKWPPGSDPSPYAPPGTQDPNAVCELAKDRCGTGQIGSYGVCTTCPGGQVGNAMRALCVPCAPGLVKYPFSLSGAKVAYNSPPANQEPTATCVDAAPKCDAGQWGNNGVCTNCLGGQVPLSPTDRTNCEYCPNGTVKHPPGTGTTALAAANTQDPTATCIPADCKCGCGEWAFRGFCLVCGSGSPKADKTGCEPCPTDKKAVAGICKDRMCPVIS
jgi:hypothetical protein